MLYSRNVFVDQFTPVSIYWRIRKHFSDSPTFLFESAVSRGDSGNYSFIVVGGTEKLVCRNGRSVYTDAGGRDREVESNPFAFLKSYYAELDQNYYREQCGQIGVGFVDGFIGFVGYDMVQEFEPVLKKTMQHLHDPLGLPDLHFVRPILILAYSHKNYRLTIVSHDAQMAEEFDRIGALVQDGGDLCALVPPVFQNKGAFAFDEPTFHAMVKRSKEMIESGDVFQILMSNRFTQKASVDPFSFYRILRSMNPSPYLFLLEYPGFAIAGSSPEVMVQLQEGRILLRPIAGTRKRGKNRRREKELEEELLSDEKERAEHIMLVDLGRNDVGRVAKKGTVKVGALMRVEKYSHVMHMVSDVEADIEEGKDMFDLFAATFTAGTMTGAPKIRAMELIAEFEGLKRSFYSGAVGYFGFHGDMDTAITIRTSLIKPDEIILQAGAGIVADSKPELEYLEVNNKLMALFASLKELQNAQENQK